MSNEVRKAAMIQAMEKSLGVVSTAAKMAGISRTAHYDWMEEDKEYKAAIDDIKNAKLDFIESKLHERINGLKATRKYKDENGKEVTEKYYTHPPSDKCITFALDRLGKDRGYVHREEVVHGSPDEFTDMSDEELQKKLSEQGFQTKERHDPEAGERAEDEAGPQ